MSSSSLHRIPRRPHGLHQHLRVIVTIISLPRHFTAQAGRSRRSKTPHSPNKTVERALTAILSQSLGRQKRSNRASSGLFEPRPRGPQPRDVYEELQLHSRLLNTVHVFQQGKVETDAREEDQWRDIDQDKNRSQSNARQSHVHDGISRSGQKGRRAASVSFYSTKTSTTNEVLQYAQRQRERMMHRRATEQDMDKIAATLQELSETTQAIERDVQSLTCSYQVKPANESLLSILRHQVRWLFQKISPIVHVLRLKLTHVDETSVQQSRPSRKQILGRMGALSLLFGALHLGPIPQHCALSLWQSLPQLLEMVELYPSLTSLLGFIVHTSSLPLLIALGPRRKKSLRKSKLSSLGRRFFHVNQRRFVPRKEAAFRELVSKHSDLLDRPLPIKAVLNDLRNLQALRGPTSRPEYKAAKRRLLRIQHESEIGEGGPLTARQLTELLQPDDSVGWTTVKQRLLLDRVDAIDSLSKNDRARVMFQRVYGIGKTRAERFVQAGFLTLEQLLDACLERAQRINLDH